MSNIPKGNYSCSYWNVGLTTAGAKPSCSKQAITSTPHGPWWEVTNRTWIELISRKIQKQVHHYIYISMSSWLIFLFFLHALIAELVCLISFGCKTISSCGDFGCHVLKTTWFFPGPGLRHPSRQARVLVLDHLVFHTNLHFQHFKTVLWMWQLFP